jgi:long-chain fatty acid transport protein
LDKGVWLLGIFGVANRSCDDSKALDGGTHQGAGSFRSKYTSSACAFWQAECSLRQIRINRYRISKMTIMTRQYRTAFRQLGLQSCCFLAVLFLATSIMNQAAVAGGFRIDSQDAFASARGEAFAATADNASAIYYNPAGIAQLRDSNIRAGAYNIWFQSSYESPGNSAKSEGKIHPIPQFFYAYGFEEIPFSFGLGAYSPYGLSIEWPDTTPFRQTAVKGSLQYLTLNPVAAWRVTPTLSVAGGLTWNHGETDLRQGLFPVGNPLYVPGDQVRFKADGNDVGYNLGLLWQVSSNVSVGVAYRSSTTIKMEGDVTITSPFVNANSAAETSFPFPDNIVGGISWRPTPHWNLEFDLDWTDWNRVNSLQVNSAVPLPPTPLNWESSFFYEFGATRYFDNGWSVSAGYIYNQNSMPNEYYNPFVADQDKHFFCLGTGYKGKHWSFDVAYQFGYGPDRTVTSVSNPGVNGTYSFISHALSLTAGFQF